MNKNDPKITKLDKYDVEANIDEVENNEEQSVYKYGFTALSNPKNVRLSIEGIASFSGDSMEREEILNKDENDVPKILTTIYQELFPTFFLLSKTLNVSCPPHQIGAMGNGSIDEKEEPELVETVAPENESTVETSPEPETSIPNDSEKEPEKEPEKADVVETTA
jgi:hypothetical protein